MILVNFLERIAHSLIYHERPERIAHGCSFVMSNLSNSLTVALLTWATWVICSQSLICHEQSEQIAHSHSFDLSDLSKWVNELWANEPIPSPGFFCKNGETGPTHPGPVCHFTPWKRDPSWFCTHTQTHTHPHTHTLTLMLYCAGWHFCRPPILLSQCKIGRRTGLYNVHTYKPTLHTTQSQSATCSTIYVQYIVQ